MRDPKDQHFSLSSDRKYPGIRIERWPNRKQQGRKTLQEFAKKKRNA